MLRDILILASCASVCYAWLCAVVAPLAQSARSLLRGARSVRAWEAFGLAVAAVVLWTAIIGATIVLAMMLEPRAGLGLLQSHLFSPGAWIGGAVWAIQFAVTQRPPRFGETFEAATVLAIVALVNDEPRTL